MSEGGQRASFNCAENLIGKTIHITNHFGRNPAVSISISANLVETLKQYYNKTISRADAVLGEDQQARVARQPAE